MSNSVKKSKCNNKRKAELKLLEINNVHKMLKSDLKYGDDYSSSKFSNDEGLLTFSLCNPEMDLKEEDSQNTQFDATVPSLITGCCEITGESRESIKWAFSGEVKNIAFNKQNEFYANIGSRPIDYFSFFLEDNFLRKICTETNAYAEKLLLTAGKTEMSRITSWKELDIQEMKIFLGLLIHMGTISLNKLHDYWKTENANIHPAALNEFAAFPAPSGRKIEYTPWAEK